MFWKWDQSCNFRQFSIWSSDAFVGDYSSVDLSWHQEVVLTFEGDQVKAICLCQDKYEGAFSERREFWIPLPNSTLHHRCLKSKLEWETLKMRQYELITWVREKNYFWKPSRHKCGQFKSVDTFQQLRTSSVPWGERQHRGEIDRHCLAPFCWRKAHCCFEIRMIGHFFRNYIWLHSLHAFSGPMHVPHAGWITARQSRPYRIKESFHIVGCKVDSPRSMHWFAKIHCIDWQLLPCCCRWQLLPK